MAVVLPLVSTWVWTQVERLGQISALIQVAVSRLKVMSLSSRTMLRSNQAQVLTFLSRLDTPKKIQDYLEKLAINFEKRGETCMSPRLVLESRQAHCMEGALFAAAALLLQGQKPLVMHTH